MLRVFILSIDLSAIRLANDNTSVSVPPFARACVGVCMGGSALGTNPWLFPLCSFCVRVRACVYVCQGGSDLGPDQNICHSFSTHLRSIFGTLLCCARIGGSALGPDQHCGRGTGPRPGPHQQRRGAPPGGSAGQPQRGGSGAGAVAAGEPGRGRGHGERRRAGGGRAAPPGSMPGETPGDCYCYCCGRFVETSLVVCFSRSL